MRRRYQKGPRPHYLILANRHSSRYNDRSIKRLTATLRKKGWFYTFAKGETAKEMLVSGQRICGLTKLSRGLPDDISRRGKVSALIVAGGDGTINKMASLAIEADLPLAILPFGKFNNIATSLLGTIDILSALETIMKREYRKIDVATVGSHLLVGSLGFGFPVELAKMLENGKQPRFGFSWASLATRIASSIETKRLLIKLDAFTFDVSPALFLINLLPYTLGLPISPVSANNDQHAEIIIDADASSRDFGTYIRKIRNGKYVYGSQFRLFRGTTISFKPPRGREFLLDGDFVRIPSENLDIKIGDQSLKVVC